MHVIGGVAIAVEGDCSFRASQQSSEPPDTVLRLTATRAEPPFRPAGTPAIELDSWVSFVDGDMLTLCIKQPGLAEAMRIELSREGLEGRYLWNDDWPYPF